MDQMNYELREGQGDNVLVLLHGTGGDKTSLMELAKYIDDDAVLVGIEGDVMEQGMRRYFARYADGSFDLESLAKHTTRLYETIERIMQEHDLGPHNINLLGYSNGANIAVNLLKTYETAYKGAFLFHPSAGRLGVPFKPQPRMRVLLTSGDNDPYITQAEFEQLTLELEDAEIRHEALVHSSGHSLIRNELDQARRMLEDMQDA